MRTLVEKSPGRLRGIQIGLGIITVISSIYALAFPADTFLVVEFVLGIILFIVGIEKIITGIFLPIKERWATIGLGILVLVFAGDYYCFSRMNCIPHNHPCWPCPSFQWMCKNS